MYEEVFISRTALENLLTIGTEYDTELDLLLRGGEEVDFGEEVVWLAIKYPKYERHPSEFLNIRKILELLPTELYYHL